MGRLQDRVAIITGAGQGIGKAYAQRFAAEGAKVVVADLNDTNAEQVAKELEASGAQVLARVDVDPRDPQNAGDRGEQHEEEDGDRHGDVLRDLPKAEHEQDEREDRDLRDRVDRRHHRPEDGARPSRAAHHEADDDAARSPEHEADPYPQQRDREVLPEFTACRHRDELPDHQARARKEADVHEPDDRHNFPDD